MEFEREHLDPQASHERAWLHTLTPYGGGSGGAKSTGYTGFYSVPEVGERVLVEFLGDWDSEAVVMGGIWKAAVPDEHNQHNPKPPRAAGQAVKVPAAEAPERMHVFPKAVPRHWRSRLFSPSPCPMPCPMPCPVLEPAQPPADALAAPKPGQQPAPRPRISS